MNKLPKIIKYVNSILEKFSEKLVYHNVTHVNDVCNCVIEIANFEKTNEHEKALLQIGALYHDIGFIEKYDGHEDVSIKIAMQSLPSFGLGSQELSIISGLIQATKLPQNPKNHLEEIMCDADLDNLGREDFFKNMDLLYEEKINFNILNNEKNWYIQTMDMMENHSYFCVSSVKRRNPGKKENIIILKQKIKEKFGGFKNTI